MDKPRKVKGLLGMISATNDGVEWELEAPSPEFVPGMGLGATSQATKWAYIGYLVELRMFIESEISLPRGRPKKDKLLSKDASRAFRVWKLVQVISEKISETPTTKTLIELCVKQEELMEIPFPMRLFPPHGDFMSSVSRGKKILEIDKDWNSVVCEKIDNISLK